MKKPQVGTIAMQLDASPRNCHAVAERLLTRGAASALAAIASLTTSLPATAQIIPNDPGAEGRLSGTFVQPSLIDGWSDSSLNAELTMMKNLHMGQLIIQWTANTRDNQSSGKKTTIYPTLLSGYTQTTRTDVVGRSLAAADAAGVAVYLGLQVNDDWWTKYATDATWLQTEANATVAIGQELWTKYGSHPSLKGWYLALESENAHFSDAVSQTNLTNFYRTTTRALHGLSSGLPVAIAPFFNAFSCSLPGWQCSDAWGASWAQILQNVEFNNPPTNPVPGIDIIALQDGIGAGHATLAELPVWFGAMQSAIITAGAHTLLFADTETYSYGLAGYIPLTSRDIVSSINAVKGMTSGYWAFSFNHYQSPRSNFGTNVYYNGYNAWVTTATGDGTDGSNPTTPGSLRLTVVNAQSINLNWTLSTDTGSGMAGYYVYRNGELIGIKLGSVSSFSDSQLEAGHTYAYQVQAFDGSGSLSPLSNPASVSTPAFPAAPNNYARCGKPAGQAGCSYTPTVAADAAYPDVGGVSLTDGVYGGATQGPAWQGRGSVGTYSFTIDLGATKTIKEINSTWLQVRNDFVFMPPTVNYYVGTKTSSLKKVASVTQPPLSVGNQTKTLRAINLSSSGRYVKVEVTSSTAWTMLDEIEIKG